jgi:S1-C subfamily serine protease
MKPLVNLLISVLVLHLVGCCVTPDIFTEGNPKVRQLQRDQTERLVDEEKKIFLKEYVGDRVVGIWAKRDTSSSPSRGNLGLRGRAAAVSPDGYFLTVYHAVDEDPFYFYRIAQSEQFKRDLKIAAEKGEALSFSKEQRKDYFTDEILRGRVVWFDRESDLALIKFGVVTAEYFEVFSSNLSLGQVVVAADTEGVGRMSRGETLEQSKGNVAYFAAGKVVRIEQLDSDVSQVVSDMVARKGMSGSAVTDLNGGLCGVLSSLAGHNEKQRFCWSPSITRERLRALMSKDRQRQSGRIKSE